MTDLSRLPRVNQEEKNETQRDSLSALFLSINFLTYTHLFFNNNNWGIKLRDISESPAKFLLRSNQIPIYKKKKNTSSNLAPTLKETSCIT